VAPENTLAAFARAISDGADGIEFDVRLSRDEVPVVIHDATLKRTGLREGLVAQLTSSELQTIDVGSWFDSRTRNAPGPYAGEKLPTLAQVFDLLRENIGLLYVEMKFNAGEVFRLAAEVARIIREGHMRERVIVESFDLSAIAQVKKIDPRIRTAALFQPQLRGPFSVLRRRNLIDLARVCGADEIALHHKLINRGFIEKIRHSGFAVVVWTVDRPVWIKRARSLGIKALIANDPATMLGHRERCSSD
jgi:glycerophosphoryl diester phosphodiesterase